MVHERSDREIRHQHWFLYWKRPTETDSFLYSILAPQTGQRPKNPISNKIDRTAVGSLK